MRIDLIAQHFDLCLIRHRRSRQRGFTFLLPLAPVFDAEVKCAPSRQSQSVIERVARNARSYWQK